MGASVFPHDGMTQLSLPFSALAIASNKAQFTPTELRDGGIEAVKEHCSPERKRMIMDAIQTVCTKKKEFSPDDVREITGEKGKENNIYGAMLMQAKKLGICSPIGYSKSKRQARHGGVHLQWRSNLI